MIKSLYFIVFIYFSKHMKQIQAKIDVLNFNDGCPTLMSMICCIAAKTGFYLD